MILLQIDLDVQATSSAQRTLGFIIALLLLAAVIVVLWRSRYAGLPTLAARRKSQLAAAKAATSFQLARFHSLDELEAAESTLFDLFDGQEPDRPSTLEAFDQARSELAGQVVPYYNDLPPLVRRLAGLTLWILVLGPIAASTAAVVAFIDSDAGVPSLDYILSELLAGIDATVSLVLAVSGAIPYLDLFLNLIFAYSLLLAEALYQAWAVWVVVLAVGVGLLYRLQDVTEDPEPETEHRQQLLHLLGGVLAVYLVGATVATLGGLLGHRELGESVGLVLSLLLGAGLAVYGLYRFANSVTEVANLRGADSDYRLATAFAARRVWSLLGVVAVPFAAAYLIGALLALPRIGSAWLHTSLAVKAGTLALVVFVATGLALRVRDTWPAIRAGLAETAADQQLRVVLGWYGFPAAGVALGYIVAYGFLRHVLLAGALAIMAGLATPRIQSLFQRLKYVPDLGSGRERLKAGRVTVEAAPLEVAGQTDYYARINGSTELLAPSVDAVVAAIKEVAEGLLTDGEPPATVEEAYHDAAADVGVTDYEEAARKSVERSRKELFGALRKADGRLELDELDEELSGVNEGAWKLRLESGIERGNLERYRDRGREVIELHRDPFAA